MHVWGRAWRGSAREDRTSRFSTRVAFPRPRRCEQVLPSCLLWQAVRHAARSDGPRRIAGAATFAQRRSSSVLCRSRTAEARPPGDLRQPPGDYIRSDGFPSANTRMDAMLHDCYRGGGSPGADTKSVTNRGRPGFAARSPAESRHRDGREIRLDATPCLRSDPIPLTIRSLQHATRPRSP